MAKSYDSIKAGWKNPKSSERGKKKSYKEIKASDYDYGVDNEYISSFIKDSQDYLNNAQKEYSSIEYTNAPDMYLKYSKQGSNLRERANNIRGYINSQKNNIDEEQYQSLLSYIDNFKTSVDSIGFSYSKTNDYFSKFNTEDEYNAYSWFNNYKDYSYNDLQKEISVLEETKKKDRSDNDAEVGKKVDWLKAFANNKDYSSTVEYDAALSSVNKQIESLATEKNTIRIRMNGYNRGHLEYTDTYQNDKARLEEIENQISTLQKSKDNLTSGRKTKKLEEDIAAYETNRSKPDFDAVSVYGENLENGSYDDFVNHYSVSTGDMSYEEQEAYFNNQPRMNNKVAFYFNNRSQLDINYDRIVMSAGNGYVAPDILLYGSTNYWDEMTDEEFSMYNYLLGEDEKKGTNEAETYLTKLEVVLGKRGYQKEKKANEKYYNDANLLEKIALNAASVPINLLSGAVSFINDTDRLITKGELNPYSAAGNAQQWVSDTRQLTAEDIEGYIVNPFLSQLASTTYQGLMSGADSLLGVAALGGGYTVTMGMGAASSKARELYESGASTGQIVLGSIVSGLIEYATEKVGIERILGEQDISTVKKVLKSIAVQGFTEGSEEINSELLNMTADALIQGYNSATEKEINQLILKCGLSEEEARNKVALGNALNVFWSGYAGFISGSGLATGAYSLGVGSSVIEQMKENNIEIKQTGTDIISNENISGLVAAAKNLADTKANAKLKALADEVAGVDTSALSETGRKAFSKKVGKLYTAVQKSQGKAISLSAVDTLRTAAEEKIRANGLTDDAEVKKATNAIIKTVYGGGALSAAETKLLEKINGEKIASELLNHENEVAAEIIKNRQDRIGQFVQTANLTSPQKNNAREINIDKYSFSDDGKTYLKGTDTAVEIADITAVDNGNMTVKLSNGEKVNLSDLDLGTRDAAIIYQGVLDMGLDAGLSQMLVNNFDFNAENGIDATTYILGVQDAVKYGKMGAKAYLDSGTFTSELNEKQREAAYRAGEITVENEVSKSTEGIKTSIRLNKKGKVVMGTTTFEGVDRNTLTARQKVTVNALEAAFGAIGVNVVFFESPVNAQGRHIGENGSYNPNTNTIRLDISAGISGQNTILFTAAHELTHFIKQWSPDKYKLFSDFLVKSYIKHGVDLESLIKNKIEASKNSETYDKPLTYDEAFEEVVADSCESFLRDSKLMDKLIDLAKQDLSLFEKTKLYIDGLLDNLRKAYAGLTPDSREGREVLKMKDCIEELHSLWEKAALAAIDNYQQSGGTIQKSTTDNSGVRYKIRTDSKGQRYWQIETEKDIFKGLKTTAQYEKAARDFLIKSRDNKTVIHAIDGKEMTFIRLSAEEFTNSEESKMLKLDNPEMFNQKMRLIPSLEDLTMNANVNWQSPDLKNHKLFKERGFENFRGKVRIDDVIFNYVVRSGKTKFGDVFYDINIEVDQILPRTVSASGIKGSTSMDRITHKNESVNTNSMQESEKYSDNSSNVKRSKRIVPDMSEYERYVLLKDKKIQPQEIEVDKNFDIEYLEKNIKSIVEKPLIKKMRDLGYLRKYQTVVIDVDFELTVGGVRKSLNSQVSHYGGNIGDFAKVIMNLQKLLDNSVLLDIHSDKAKGTPKENARLKQTYVLLSAFSDDTTIKPVQFEVKQYIDNDNRLYLAVALTKIETGVMGNTATQKELRTTLVPISNISIFDLVSKINPKDRNLFKYIPNQFLSEEQIEAKNTALKEESIKYGEKLQARNFDAAVIDESDVKFSERDNSEMTDDDYFKLLSKKPINVSKEIKAKIGKQRISRYGHMPIEEIPIVDFFRVADYNKVNVAYKYTVRNESKDHFLVIRKQQIKPQGVPKELNKLIQEERENARVNSRTDKSRNGRYDNSLGDNRIGYGGTVQANDRMVTGGNQSNQERYNAQGISNIGRGIKFSDRDFNALTDRGLLADALEGASQNDIILYSETQYNNFGWVRVNEVLTASEYNTLLSRYADYKHNKDKYPITRFGEAVIHSTECPDVIMYVKGAIRSPKITKVVKIEHEESWAIPFIKEEILSNEYKQDVQPFATVENYFGYGVLDISKARDYGSFREKHTRRNEGESGKTSNSFSGKQQNGAGSAKESERADKTGNATVKYQARDTTAVTDRGLLVEALESVAKNDIERNKLKEYKGKIDLMYSEQEKLSELKREIKEISFSKGKRDMTKLRQLQDEVIKTANRINNYDRQLLRLEAARALQNVLSREKEIAVKKQKQKDKAILTAYREEQVAKIDAVAKRYQEARKKSVEGRQKTVLRNKLKKVIKELDSILNHGTKKRNVKEGLKDTVHKALAAAEVMFNTDITDDELVRSGISFVSDEDSRYLKEYADLLDQRDVYLEKIDALKEKQGIKVAETIAELAGMVDKVNAKIFRLGKKLSKVFAAERKRLNDTAAAEAISLLVDAYDSIKYSDDEYIKNAYSEELRKRLDTLKESIGGTTVKDMSLVQLREVYDAFKMVKHTVATANNLFRNGKAESLKETVNIVQTEIMAYYRENKVDSYKLAKKTADMLRSFSWNELKPYYAFERLGSEKYIELFWDAVYAESVYAQDITEAKEFLKNQMDIFGYANWDTETAKTFRTADGRDFKLTLEEMMSIYAYSRREQAEKHMTEGGFIFDENSEYKEKGITKKHERYPLGYQVDEALLGKIIAELGPERIAFVENVQGYLTQMGEKGNEVSRILYGVDIFKEKNYFPLKSHSDYLNSTVEALKATPTQVSMKNSRMTNPTAPGANNPIVLKGFSEIVAEHIDEMSKYHAFVIPIENLQRVFNNASVTAQGQGSSTKDIITSVFGESATRYFNQYIIDLNGGTHTGGAHNPVMQMFSKAKSMSVAANLSVIVQQPFAVIRAMGEIDAKYFVSLQKVENNTNLKKWELIKKYSGTAVIKEMGGFDIGSSRSAKNYISGKRKFGDKVRDASMWGAEKMDELGWGIIWDAVEREISAEQGFAQGSDEYYAACGKRFTEVVSKTQVYDSVNNRSGYMRSRHDSVKYITSFMGEPTTIINMAYISFLKLYRAYKSGDTAKIRQAQKKLARTGAALVASSVLTSLAQSFIYAMRDDDEDEAFLEKWAKHFGLALRDNINPLNLIPICRDIMSIIEGWNVERPDMTLISDVIVSFKKICDDDASAEEWLEFAGAAANAFGIPFDNIYRDVKGLVNFIGDVSDDNYPTDIGGAFLAGLSGDEDYTLKTQAVNAFNRGDSTATKTNVNEMVLQKVKSGKTEKQAKSAVRTSFTSSYKPKYLDAVQNGDYEEMNNIRRLLYATGLYGTLTELDDDLKKWRTAS